MQRGEEVALRELRRRHAQRSGTRVADAGVQDQPIVVLVLVHGEEPESGDRGDALRRRQPQRADCVPALHELQDVLPRSVNARALHFRRPSRLRQQQDVRVVIGGAERGR
eukprot:4817341-Heterocapsa_arctica.AAC.1